MNEIFDFLSRPTWQHLATALLHSLWEGPTVMILLWLLLRRIPANRPEIRYRVAFSALLGIVVCVLVTWSILDFDRPNRPASAKTAMATAAAGRPSADVVHHDRSPANEEGTSGKQFGDRTENRPAWLPYILFGWLLGVVLMMFRMAWIVARLRRLLRVPEVTDHRLRLLIEELRQLMHIARSLRVVDSLEGFGPAVFGFVRPIMALPVSMISGLPPNAVRAILAHELAHIRRHDYLFNLAQMVIEAVLYFNPAVWWINRQIRIEREACCDALAASILGQPLVIAEALSVWAERVHAQNRPIAAMAWTGREGPRLLLDRIRRMVLPGYRPQSPISSVGLLGLLLTGILVLGGLWCGTSAAVQLVEKILTPEERIEKVTEEQKKYSSTEEEEDYGKQNATLSGTIRTIDGKPLPEEIHIAVKYRNPRGGGSKGVSLYKPSFSVEVPPSRCWLQVSIEGYATAVAGPFRAKANETTSGIEIVLEHGYPVTVHLADEKGEPVTNAKVFGGVETEGYASLGPLFTSDDKGNGVIFVTQKSDQLFYFAVNKPGFQPIASTITVNPDKSVTLKIAPAKPVEGVVLSPEGKPVARAEIRKYMEMNHDSPTKNGPILAVTDDEGHYILQEMKDGATYMLVAESKEFGRHPFRVDMPVKKELSIKYGPNLTVSGSIRGKLEELDIRDEKPIVWITQNISLSEGNSSDEANCQWTAPVEIIEGAGKFTFQGLLPGSVSIMAGKHNVQTNVSPSEPRREVEIDLSQPVVQEKPRMRQVIMRFETTDSEVSPQGTIEIRSNGRGNYESKAIGIEKGIAKFDAYVGESLSYAPKGMIGYWFIEDHETSVESEEGPLEIIVPVIAAGAITGQVFEADGKPAGEGIMVSCHGVMHLQNMTRHSGFGEAKLGENGKFYLGPVPLGAKCAVKATRGHTIQISKVQLNEAHPTANLILRLPKTTVVEGKILDPDGHPMAGLQFDLAFSGYPEQGGNRWNGNTNNDGKFRFDDLSVNIGKYSIEFTPIRNYQSFCVPLPLDGKPVTVQLQRGRILEGQVLDNNTGWPVPGVEVYAAPVGDSCCNAEGVSDNEGRFRFSNLDNRPYELNVRNCNLYRNQPPLPKYQPGDRGVVIEVILPDWCKLKPQQPDRK